MALFEFELAHVEDITPWGHPGELNLHWFALTDGRFRMVVGEQVLFRYTEEIASHWKMSHRDADYQIASIARDILGSVPAAVALLPPRIERLACDWEMLTELKRPIEDDSDGDDELWDLKCAAWRWLDERSPWTGYLVAHPDFQFVRIRDELHIHWDNRDRIIDGIPVWTAQCGVHVMPVAEFLEECRDFSRRLVCEMDERIAGIKAGTLKPQVKIDMYSLRYNHEAWRAEFEAYFGDYRPEFSWEQAENALQAIADLKGIRI